MMRIYLVGARASGKTTVGRRLAGDLGLSFVDTDIRLGQRHGLTVAEVVAKVGWPAFRALESEVLAEVAAEESPAVVATGGGMILAEANRALMKRSGLVFYLSAPAEVLAARLLADPKTEQRPSLTGRSVVEEVAQVLAERERLYREAAHQVVDASADFEEEIAAIKAGLAALQDAGAAGPQPA